MVIREIIIVGSENYVIANNMDNKSDKNNIFGIVQFGAENFLERKIQMELLSKCRGLHHIVEDEVPEKSNGEIKRSNVRN